MVENAKLERRAFSLLVPFSLLLHLLPESDRNRKIGERERTRVYRRRILALVAVAVALPQDGQGGFPYMDSSLSPSSFLKGSFVPTASGLRYREKERLIRSILRFLSLKTLVNRRGTLGFIFSSLASLVTNPLFEFKSVKRVQRAEVFPLKMMWFMRFSGLLFAIMVMILFSPHFQSFPPAEAIRSSHHDGNLRVPILIPAGDSPRLFSFRKASTFNNAEECGFRDRNYSGKSSVCDPFLVHVAITLDVHYLRGSMAAVHSILQHSQCPEDIFFHFLVSETQLEILVRSTFPQLKFKVYYFNPEIVRNLISTSVREALEHPLNYARNYLADLLEPCVRRVIYLDSDLIVVDDIYKLWSTSLGSRTIGAPEYCHANFTRYFTDKFWSEKRYYGTFDGRKPCYFNTGVIVIDLVKWRRFGFTKRIERWMEVQKHNRIYELGSLPPYLLVFAGHVAPIEHRWNQHGLGGDNVKGSCRDLHSGPVSLLHWSGSGKPWARLDMKAPCPIDAVWSPYDLYRPIQ